jgi:hypothetical protein
MSGSKIHHPVSPFIAPTGGDLDQKLAMIATAINKKADAGLAGPSFHFIALIAPDGTTWRVEVDSTGALLTTLAERS